MEIGIVVVIVIVLGIFGGAAALVATGTGTRAAELPGWAAARLHRPSRRVPRAIEAPLDGPGPAGDLTAVVTPVEETPVVALARLGDELRATLAARDDRLARLDQRIDVLREQLSGRLEAIGRDVEARWDEVAAIRSAGEDRQEVALERLRADLGSRLAERDARAASLRSGERRAEVTAELYARLARLETAVAAVTNPILLPGEPYAPPTDLLAEALAWDNWKDVGERAFAFADAFSAQRLYLSEPTRTEIAAFVISLRGLLTRSIYPNLHPRPTPAQEQALRSALNALAVQLPQLRSCLETEYARATDPGSEAERDRSGSGIEPERTADA